MRPSNSSVVLICFTHIREAKTTWKPHWNSHYFDHPNSKQKRYMFCNYQLDYVKLSFASSFGQCLQQCFIQSHYLCISASWSSSFRCPLLLIPPLDVGVNISSWSIHNIWLEHFHFFLCSISISCCFISSKSSVFMSCLWCVRSF